MTELELERLLRSQACALAAQPLPPGLRERLLAPSRSSMPMALRRSAPLLGLLAVQVAVSAAATLAAVALRPAASPAAPADSPPSATGVMAEPAAPAGVGSINAPNFDRVVLQGRHAINDAWLAQISACRRLGGARFPEDAAACRSTTLGLGHAATEFAVALGTAPPPPDLGTGVAALSQALADLQTQCARLVAALDVRDPAGFASAADYVGYQPWAVDMALIEN